MFYCIIIIFVAAFIALWYASRPLKSASVMLVLNDEGKILSVSRRYDSTKFGLPGGKSEDFETPKETAIRETLEETGIKVNSCVEIYKRIEPPSHLGGTPFFTHCFYATNWEGTPEESDEGVVEWLSSSDLTVYKGAFPEYNKNTLNKFKELFPEVHVL